MHIMHITSIATSVDFVDKSSSINPHFLWVSKEAAARLNSSGLYPQSVV